MTDRQFTPVAFDGERLGFVEADFSGGRVPDVPDGAVAGQPVQDRLGEDFIDFTHAAYGMQALSVTRHDADGFLPAVLQGIETQVGEPGRFGMPPDAEHPTFFTQLVLIPIVHRQTPSVSFAPGPASPATVAPSTGSDAAQGMK